MLWWILCWLFGWPFRVKKLKAKRYMSDVLLSWELQNPTSRQRPVDYIRVDYRVDESLPWTEQDRISPDGPQELLFSDVAPGTHYYRVTVVDIDGVESPNPPTTQASIDFDAPFDVINLTVAIQ